MVAITYGMSAQLEHLDTWVARLLQLSDQEVHLYVCHHVCMYLVKAAEGIDGNELINEYSR